MAEGQRKEGRISVFNVVGWMIVLGALIRAWNEGDWVTVVAITFLVYGALSRPTQKGGKL